MPSIQELREQRKRKYEEARALVDTQSGERWTPQVQAKYDGLVKDLDGINDQIFRHERIMTETVTNISQGHIPNARPGREDNPEHTEAFNRWVRVGDELGLRQFRVSAEMTTGTGGKGGFLIPEQMNSEIDRLATDQSAMRTVCEVRQITTPEYKRIMSLGGTASGWVGETEARPSTDTSDLTASSPHWGTVYAYPLVSQDMLDFSGFDVAGFLTQEVGDKFAEDEGAAFISGDGVKKPRGILDFPWSAAADGARPFGTLKYEVSGSASAIGNFDSLKTLVYSPKRAYRKNATWLMNSNTACIVSKIKDGEGRYMWQDAVTAGQPAMLFGYPVEIDDFLPDVAADAIPILFGDFRRGFMIVDLPTMAMLRDPYTSKPFVGFYFLRRVGTLLKNSEAIRGLKIAA